nr:toxin-activating lysine-acyltransferase [Brevundimonas diminuta]
MTNTPSPAAQAQEPKTVSQMLGEIVWLMTQSPVHKQLFIGDLEWFAMPAILLEQFRTFYGPNAPAAVAFWAMVSEETEQRLEAGAHKLRADEWKGGDRPWLIELVAPFGAQEEILADLSLSVFNGMPFKFHAVGADGQRVVKIYETPEANLN